MTYGTELHTYKTFEEVTAQDKKVIDAVKKYGHGEKCKTIHSFKSFWRKLAGNIAVIGNGTEEDPQYIFALTVETAAYIGKPDKISFVYWVL